MQNPQKGQLAHINVFTPKPGMLDEFIATQLDGASTLGEIPGFRGSRLYRATDGSHAIQIAYFDDEGAHRRFMQTPEFQRQRQKLLPLLEGANPGFYTLVSVRDEGPNAESLAIAGAAGG